MATLSSPRPLAVVTGASSGIGYELAKQFAQNGFDMVIAADEDRIRAAAQDLQRLGGQVEAAQVDLATYDGVEALYAVVQATGRAVDGLALNAGVGVGGDFARDTDLKDELRLIALNVTSTVHLAKRVVSDMVARGKGRVLFTSSIAGTMPAPLMAVYAASKAFTLSFAASLRNELKDTGVTVTALLPGPTDTEFFHRAHMDNTNVAMGKKDDPADVARQGFEALMAGDERVVAAGLGTKLEGAMARLTPESIKAERHRKTAEPGQPQS